MSNEDRAIPSIVIALITCLLMIFSILFFPHIQINKLQIDAYWVIILIGSILVAEVSETKIDVIGQALIENSAVNPLKIVGLFICMTLLSVFIDELGFFQFLASYVLKKASSSQVKLFLYLYVTVSVLTVFTSNDVIILAFTPFLCYFSQNANINPMPFLAGEFIAANTWSMALIIGNPTNIYLGTAFNLNFVDYLKVMILPTLCAGVTAFTCLYLLFKKELAIPISDKPLEFNIYDRYSSTGNSLRDTENPRPSKSVTIERTSLVVGGVRASITEDLPKETVCKEHLVSDDGEKQVPKLQVPIKENEETEEESPIKDKVLLCEGLIHLIACVVILAIGSFLNIEMWFVSCCAVGSLFLIVLITCALKQRMPIELSHTLIRAPWQLIPFVIGMFMMILCIKEMKVTNKISDFLKDTLPITKYGALSFLSANIINNIPMSILFCPILEGLTSNSALYKGVFATIIGSNIGAFFTPIGALAGIMFTSIVGIHDIKFGYLDFLKLGIFIAIPTMVVALIVLNFMLMIFHFEQKN